MKPIYIHYKDGEPSRTTHRFTLTKQDSANARFSLHFDFRKISRMKGLFEKLEEEEKLVKSMEICGGLAA